MVSYWPVVTCSQLAPQSSPYTSTRTWQWGRNKWMAFLLLQMALTPTISSRGGDSTEFWPSASPTWLAPNLQPLHSPVFIRDTSLRHQPELVTSLLTVWSGASLSFRVSSQSFLQHPRTAALQHRLTFPAHRLHSRQAREHLLSAPALFPL